jgi:hypothetical protein
VSASRRLKSPDDVTRRQKIDVGVPVLDALDGRWRARSEALRKPSVSAVIRE